MVSGNIFIELAKDLFEVRGACCEECLTNKLFTSVVGGVSSTLLSIVLTERLINSLYSYITAQHLVVKTLVRKW